MTPFVHLHTHSLYSPMEGIPSLEALCLAAHKQENPALALTDSNGLYGAIRFLAIAREANLRPILGTQLKHGPHRAVLLGRSSEGYANLCRLISARHCDADFHLIRAVSQYLQRLVLLSDDLTALRAWKKDGHDDLYVEFTPGAMMHEALAWSRASHVPNPAD
jgi:DNA polymerase III alpha subunit